MKNRPVLVQNIIPGSIAEDAGIEKGDKILSINNEIINDIFDYRFLITNEELIIKIEKNDSQVWEIEIEKDEYEDLGIEFESLMIDEAKSCRNKCIFCFIDQLPEGMRDTLYFKDDDSRLSFFMGNYVTLTNMSYNDIDRIIKYRMSPINVSVHSTNPELRTFMLGNRFAGDVMEKIQRLVDGGISVNCQIVLCRGINDGNELERSIEELAAFYPSVSSISVVPVGITRFREKLYELKPFDKDTSLTVIRQVEEYQKEYLDKYGSRIVYLADEFYIMAAIPIPGYEAYEDFPQIENGVGLIAMFKAEFEEYVQDIEFKLTNKRNVSIATGVSSYAFITEMAQELEKRFFGLNVSVYKIKNNFFGENVTVSGLLTGNDLVQQLSGRELGDELMLPKSMFKAGEEVFLDDYTLVMLENELKVKVTVVENSGKDFVEKILGIAL